MGNLVNAEAFESKVSVGAFRQLQKVSKSLKRTLTGQVYLLHIVEADRYATRFSG